MAEPQGTNYQIEQVMIDVLQQAFPTYTTSDTPPTTRPVTYRGWWSKEQMVFPLVEVQCRMGSYTPTAAGGAYNVSRTGVMVPTGAAAAFPSQVQQVQIVNGGRYDDNEVDLKLSAQSAAERSILSGRLRALLFSGYNPSNVAWIRVLSYYGVRMLRISPDMFDEESGLGVENVPMVFTNILTVTVSTTVVSIRIPSFGDGASLVETLLTPAGIAPPPTF